MPFIVVSPGPVRRGGGTPRGIVAAMSSTEGEGGTSDAGRPSLSTSSSSCTSIVLVSRGPVLLAALPSALAGGSFLAMEEDP